MKRTLVLMCLILQACSHGFDRGVMRQGLANSVIVSDKDISEVLERKPQLRSPFKLGIWLNEPNGGHGSTAWSWTEQDKETLLAWFGPLKTKGIISDVFLVNEHVGENTDLKQIRLSAARYGADAVLTVKGVGDVDTYANPLVFFDIITLTLTGFIIPANQQDTLFMVRATLWDVRNEYLYVEAEAEGTDEAIAPMYWNVGRSRRAIRLALEAALPKLERELMPRIESLGGGR